MAGRPARRRRTVVATSCIGTSNHAGMPFGVWRDPVDVWLQRRKLETRLIVAWQRLVPIVVLVLLVTRRPASTSSRHHVETQKLHGRWQRPDAQFVTIRKMCPSSAVYCAICLPSSSFASHTSQLACAVLSHGHVYDLRQSPFAPPPITTLWGFSGGGLRR